MEWKVAPSYKYAKIVAIDEENHKAQIEEKCDRCGGSGIMAARVENGHIVPIPVDGGICYKCWGEGKIRKWVKAYTEEEMDKYLAAQERAKQKKAEKANNGYLAMVEWTQGNFFGGFNKLSFTYGHDGLDGVVGNHAGDNVVPYSEKGNGFRFIDWGVIEQPSWNLGYAFIWSHHNAFDENETEGGANWNGLTGTDFNFVLRPSYKWSDFTSTVLEFGYYNFSNNYIPQDDDGNVIRPIVVKHGDHRKRATKLTLAQQWTPGSQFWARPSIRVFASWLSGNAYDHFFDDKNDSHQITLGAQVEAWW